MSDSMRPTRYSEWINHEPIRPGDEIRLPIALIERLESWFGPLTEDTFTAVVLPLLLDEYEKQP